MGRLQPTPVIAQRENEISRTIYVGNVLTAVRRLQSGPHPASRQAVDHLSHVKSHML